MTGPGTFLAPSWKSALGAIAVVVTLFYLAIQIRLNTRAMQT